MRAKTAWGIVAVLVLAIALAGLGYGHVYSIRLNWAALPKVIQEIGDLEKPVTLYGGVGIGRNEYIFLETGESLGTVTLERGLTGRYRLKHLGYGDGNFVDGIVEDGGKTYLLFGGRDYAARISKISCRISGRTYELDAGNESRFLLYTEIDRLVEDSRVDRSGVHFYGDTGEEITELYDLGGGGIE